MIRIIRDIISELQGIHAFTRQKSSAKLANCM
uniref:Uncharacterized protein n=1 Tax=Rhizophora mucronata TaxID=61149 RepID=A0A2P2PEA9_RHIMU